ncbi:MULTISPECIES: hypothetical protein [Paenibacillus]|uniref:hypothetical protein n=1 Tax=Paenibacillus TaxID=44249 RepID=UPI001C47E580|nr:hypothetical protein [Paenibacillus chitinolyticus]MBV6717233.1 hypothetical protein [Paenibacillus chitinolyticus]
MFLDKTERRLMIIKCILYLLFLIVGIWWGLTTWNDYKDKVEVANNEIENLKKQQIDAWEKSIEEKYPGQSAKLAVIPTINNGLRRYEFHVTKDEKITHKVFVDFDGNMTEGENTVLPQ